MVHGCFLFRVLENRMNIEFLDLIDYIKKNNKRKEFSSYAYLCERAEKVKYLLEMNVIQPSDLTIIREFVLGCVYFISGQEDNVDCLIKTTSDYEIYESLRKTILSDKENRVRELS